MNDSSVDPNPGDVSPPTAPSRPWRKRLMALLLILGLALVAYVGVQVARAPSVSALEPGQAPEPGVLMSADGKVLMRFQREQRQPVSLKQVSPHVIKALIDTEDHRFYEHSGVDWLRFVKAIMRTATGRTEGGSTITQQLARNLFPEEIGRARNVNRKIKEFITALRIERIYTKDQIIESYLNTTPFLYNVVGIEMAARTYFDKSAKDLDVLESATLIGMLKGTHYYNPVIHPERARQRRNLVLAQMVRHGDLAQAELDRLKGRPVKVRFNRQSEEWGLAPHFAMHVRKWLQGWAEEHDYDVYRDGLVVETTLDAGLQAAAAEAVARQGQALQDIADVEWSQSGLSFVSSSPEGYARLADRRAAFEHFWRRHPSLLADAVRDTPEFKQAVEGGASKAEALAQLLADSDFVAKVKSAKTRLEAGLVALDPATGEVKAWVGSRDFEQDQFDHVAQAERQPGSTFKPIVYGAALEQGMSPSRTYPDVPLEIPLGDGTVWRPTDMAGYSGRAMTLWEGLVYSKNIITARVMQDVGLPAIAQLAKAMGVRESKLDQVPSMALGTSPVTLLEMASVYATIANGGEYRAPVTVKRIRDRHGEVLAEFTSEGQRAMSFGSAMNLIDMMRGVVTYGTGNAVRSRFGVRGDVAGKTGTTQNNTDGWFIAMHPRLVVGGWVGFNDQHVTMRSSYWGQGGHNAVRLVGDLMQTALKRKWLDASATFATPLREPITATVYATDAPLDLGEGDVPGTEAMADPAAPMVDEAGQPVDSGIEVMPGQEGEPPKSEAELGRILGGMGRDPATGAPLASPPASAPPPSDNLQDLIGPRVR